MYKNDIMRAVRSRWGLKPDDTSKDEKIMEQNKSQTLEDYFAWHGIIGYGDEIIDIVSEIFGVLLDD